MNFSSENIVGKVMTATTTTKNKPTMQKEQTKKSIIYHLCHIWIKNYYRGHADMILLFANPKQKAKYEIYYFPERIEVVPNRLGWVNFY